MLQSKRIKLLLEFSNRPITKRGQSIYVSGLGYYQCINFLKDHGLVECRGTDEKNQKIWVLTEKGKKFVGYLNKIKELLMEVKT